MAPAIRTRSSSRRKDFLEAIAGGKPRWPTFRDGMVVNQVIEAAWQSQEKRGWVNIDNV